MYNCTYFLPLCTFNTVIFCATIVVVDKRGKTYCFFSLCKNPQLKQPKLVSLPPFHFCFENVNHRMVKLILINKHTNVVQRSLKPPPLCNDMSKKAVIARNVTPVNYTLNTKEWLAGRDIEKNVLTHVVQVVCNEKVFIIKNKTILFVDEKTIVNRFFVFLLIVLLHTK